MNEITNKTLSQIVTENYGAAPVFEKYGLDFCCKGKRQLKEACAEKGISVESLLDELNPALAENGARSNFNSMSITELAEYIVRVHHSFVKQNSPQILNYVLKIATRHGDRFPYMKEVLSLFSEVKEEMEQHMMKEERVLFPRIKQLEFPDVSYTSAEFLQDPINMMEAEHDHAGTIMQQIRTLTNNYDAPEEACTTHRLTLDLLKAFEEDLHQHVHLENNILFPKAIQKSEELSTKA